MLSTGASALPLATLMLVSPLSSIAFLLTIENQRVLGPHHDLAITAETVAVDRRIRDDDLLVRIVVIIRAGVFVDAIDVIVALPVERVEVPAAHGRNRQRQGLLIVIANGRAEDARRIELVAPQFGHQPAAGALPKPPADQLLQRRAFDTLSSLG